MAESQLISWRYLAGFFDGEGNISKPTRTSGLKLRISQKRPEVMHRIAERLEYHGVSYAWNNRATKFGTNHITMTIHRQADVQFVLRKLLPHLIVKRQEAMDALIIIANKKPHGNLKRVIHHS